MADSSSRVLNAAIYERTQILVGNEGITNLFNTNVLLVGVGGVGGHCAEALVRAGIGKLTIVDGDVVSATNKNRQLIALDSTIGKSKVESLAGRLRDVSAHCQITAIDGFLLPEDVGDLLGRESYDFLVDCIDSVECKLALVEAAVRKGLRVVCSGGAGGRLDPSQVKVGDIFETENDALSRIVRQHLRKCGFSFGCVRTVFSSEKGRPPLQPQRQENGGRDRAVNGTISYMPPLFGLMLASEVIRDAQDPAEAKKRHKKLLKDYEKAQGAPKKWDASKQPQQSGDAPETKRKRQENR